MPNRKISKKMEIIDSENRKSECRKIVIIINNNNTIPEKAKVLLAFLIFLKNFFLVIRSRFKKPSVMLICKLVQIPRSEPISFSDYSQLYYPTSQPSQVLLSLMGLPSLQQ